MRLTLRTLLAYLDNTLDPQDVEALRDKLSESGFATQLVQRIRDTLTRNSLTAPSPQAVGPVEEANVISEYLDSTLPAEQVAEIERACLESDPHLAEAAACHQILTMVLGRSAEVSPELRQRIYELPEKNVEEIAASAGSFSSLVIPEQPDLGSLQDVIPTADAGPDSSHSGEAVQPVGIGDSGVSDAPTRLRETDDAEQIAKTRRSPAIAGSKPRLADDSTSGFGGTVRTSRITPWLVSLALAGVLLFALTRIFAPLLNNSSISSNPDVVLSDPEQEVVEPADDDADASAKEIEVDPADAPPMVVVEDPLASDMPKENVDTLPSPDVTESTTQPDPSAANPPPDSPTVEASAIAGVDPDKTATDSAAAPADSSDAPIVGSDNVDPGPTAVVEVPLPTATTEPAMPEKVADAAATAEPDPKAEPDSPPPPVDVDAAPVIELARVTSENTLLIGLVAEERWIRLKKDMPVGENQKVICAPTFRGKLTSVAKVDVTMVGPAQIQWSGAADAVTLQVDFGRVLLSATEPDTSLDIVIGEYPVTVVLSGADTIVAVSVMHFRAPGFDPLLPANRIPLAGVLSVQGTAKLTSDNTSETLVTGQQWVKRGDGDAKISPVEIVPDWIDPPDPTEPSLESGAREGLLAILGDGQALDLSLREATSFRRAEVGALAGQTLLVMGRPDVYFGGDGILSEPKQRAYWPDHFRTLMDVIDQSSDRASQVIRSVAKMDSAHAKSIQRLIAGYSQKQLVEGGDEELVNFLDSPSMAVRVLALENLHKITGTTLYFRAEQDNAIRRAPGIKKWEVRQRKGDIRWQE